MVGELRAKMGHLAELNGHQIHHLHASPTLIPLKPDTPSTFDFGTDRWARRRMLGVQISTLEAWSVQGASMWGFRHVPDAPSHDCGYCRCFRHLPSQRISSDRGNTD